MNCLFPRLYTMEIAFGWLPRKEKIGDRSTRIQKKEVDNEACRIIDGYLKSRPGWGKLGIQWHDISQKRSSRKKGSFQCDSIIIIIFISRFNILISR